MVQQELNTKFCKINFFLLIYQKRKTLAFQCRSPLRPDFPMFHAAIVSKLLF